MDVHAQGPTNDSVERTLVDPQHVRHRFVEERIEATDDVDEHDGEFVASCVVERWEIGNVDVGREQQFEGPLRGRGHGGAPRADGRHEQSRVDGERVLSGRVVLGRGGRWDVGEGVDLAMRMIDGRADRSAAVLEHEHVGDVVA